MMMHKLFNLIFLNLMCFVAIPVSARALSDFEWQNRPLLIFAPQMQDQRLQQLNEILRNKSCALDDRDIIIGVIVTQGPSSLANQTMSVRKAELIRHEYKIQADQFAVLLIGKDGGEKLRLYEIPDLSDIFNLIDGMPMRQTEMLASPVDCNT